MTVTQQERDRLYDLVLAMEAGTISPSEVEQLDQLVCGRVELAQQYARYARLLSDLRFGGADERLDAAWTTATGALCDGNGQKEANAQRARCVDAPLPPLTMAGLPNTVGGLFSGWLAAYLVATVVFAIGLAVGAIVHVSRPGQYVGPAVDARHPEPGISNSSPIVGRITGMVDCVWEGSGFRVQGSDASDQKSDIRNQRSIIRLGDRVALRSGVLEITYDAGARVILQGPVTYEVESSAGGYLSVGKLTARLEKKSEVRGQRSELANHRSEIINHRFAVRTPTATVTDLGTEFGVEVNKDGTTQVHVIQGVVEACHTARQGKAEHRERLTQGAAVEIGVKVEAIKAVAFAPQRFVRKLQPNAVDASAEAAYVKAVLADKPLGYWPLNEPAGARKFVDRSGNSFHGYAMSKVMAGERGPLAGNSRAVALDGNGYIDVGRHDEFALKNDFSVEAWICGDSIGSTKAARVVSAGPGVIDGKFTKRDCGWSFEASYPWSVDGKPIMTMPTLCFSTYAVKDYYCPISNDIVSRDRWLHVAVVYDPDNSVHFYLNGQYSNSIAGDARANVGPIWLEIGGGAIGPDYSNGAPEYWNGCLAHIAIYPRMLSPEQINRHYRQMKR